MPKANIPNIALNMAQKIDIDFLQLDYENPRVIDITEKTDTAFIIKFSKHSDLKEIISSMPENGYMDIEPLIVIKGQEKYIVLEGNRRLAALLLLRDKELAKKCNIDLPNVNEEKQRTFHEKITVYRVESREDARAFIGFKHINGPHKWDSFAKGKYATLWYRAGSKSGLKVDDIARQIGDSHDTINKMIKGYMVLEQAIQNNLYSLEDRVTPKFAFSHLYTALTRTEYCNFLGLDKDWRTGSPVENPISEEKYEELHKLLCWLYGSKSEKQSSQIRTQNPDLAKLGKVIINSEARAALEAGATLEAAYLKLSSGSELFAMELAKADQSLANAMGNLYSYEGGLLGMASRIQKQINIIYEYMEKEERNFK